MSKLTKINYNEFKTNKISENNTEFVIQPLERGMANTLGTSLRRVLLSSVYGISVFGIKISGVDYEYQKIDGVDVDVMTLSHRLSKIIFVCDEEIFVRDEIFKVQYKSSTNSKQILVKDLILPPQIKISKDVDENEVIAKISDGVNLEIELFIKTGRGYVDSKLNKKILLERRSEIISEIKTGVILPLDSNFSPIIRVAHRVEELHTSSYNVQEKLILEIETNGSISAVEAISQASKILIAHYTILGNVDNLDINSVFVEKEEKKEISILDSMIIEDLDLNIRSLNGLKKAGITKVSQLVNLSSNDLKNIQAIGEKSVDEIIKKLKEKNIDLSKEGEE